MSKFFWPCHVARDGDGQHRVIPFDLAGCNGIGTTLEEATEAARVAVIKHMKVQGADFIMPPMAPLDPDDMVNGLVTRLEIDLPE